MDVVISIAVLAIVIGLCVWLYRDKEAAKADLVKWDEYFKHDEDAIKAKVISVDNAVKGEVAKVETAAKAG